MENLFIESTLPYEAIRSKSMGTVHLLSSYNLKYRNFNQHYLQSLKQMNRPLAF